MDGHCRSLDHTTLHLPIALDISQPAALQDLIDEWHGQRQGLQALVIAPRRIALQIKRFAAGGAKLVHPVIMLDTIALPVFDDGFHLRHVTYQADAIVFHIGECIETGHYQTVLLRSEQWYITNDGIKPAKAAHNYLTTAVASNAYLIMRSQL